MIQKDIDLTNYLKEKIIAAHDFELIADSPLAICCFRFKGGLTKESDILSLNEKLIPALEKDDGYLLPVPKLIRKWFWHVLIITEKYRFYSLSSRGNQRHRKSIDFFFIWRNFLRILTENKLKICSTILLLAVLLWD